MIKVVSDVQVYEVNGDDVQDMKLTVSSYHLSNKVVMNIDGKNYTVMAGDLIAAINNAINTNPW